MSPLLPRSRVPPVLPDLPPSPSPSGSQTIRARSVSQSDPGFEAAEQRRPKSARGQKPSFGNRLSWRQDDSSSSESSSNFGTGLDDSLSTYALPEDGSFVSATLQRIQDEEGMRSALGVGSSLALSISGIHVDINKAVWYLIKVRIVQIGGLVKSSWTVPRNMASFQSLAKALHGSTTVELPRFKAGSISESESILVLKSYVIDLCNAQSELAQQSVVLLKFADPFDSPGTFGLRMLEPMHQGWMDLILVRGGKASRYYVILKEHLYYFKSATDEVAAGMVSLDYVTIELVTDASLPRCSFSITSLQKDIFICALDSTKNMSEWIIRIRKAKFHRTGLSYGLEPPVMAGSKIGASSISPRHNKRPIVFRAFAESEFKSLPANLSVDVGRDSIPVSSIRGIPDSPDNFVGNESGSQRIKEASASKLVERLLNPSKTAPQFVYLFLATFRYWLKPAELFSYMVGAWLEEDLPVEAANLNQIRVLLILKIWIQFHFYDFADDSELTKGLLSFLHHHLQHYEAFKAYTNVLVTLIKEQMRTEPHVAVVGAANTILPAVFSKDHIEFIDLHPLEIARQLTLVTFGLYTAIEGKELMSQRWNSPEKDTVCPNVMRMIRRFNQASLWVQTVVLAMDTIIARVSIIQRLLDVCTHLLELNNFSTVFEIVSGMQGSAVKRLSSTWEALTDDGLATWNRLKDLLDSTSNFKNYRSALAECTGPSIPHLGLVLTDLTFAEDSGKIFGESGRVNFAKCAIIGNALVDIMRRQKIPYALKPVDYILLYFSQLRPQDEKDLYERSCTLQPKRQAVSSIQP